jgi:ligand-binding SRPBCC domain-containing protein
LTPYLLETELWLPRRPAEAFAFFSDARNLERITPPWLQFQILTAGPPALRQGSLLEYRLRWRRLPVRWLTEITAWEPPRRFVDRQLRGPYRLWVHEHLFEEQGEGTLIRDRVRYAVPGGPLAPLLHRLLVGPDVRKIFAHRRQVLTAIFNGGPSCSKTR